MKYRNIDRIKSGIESFLGIGVLIYIESSEISNQFINGNVPDMIYPITNYALSRILFCKNPNVLLAGSIAAAGTMAEIAQNYGWCPGTFDLKDIPMYFIGAGIAYGIDKLTYNSKRAESEI